MLILSFNAQLGYLHCLYFPQDWLKESFQKKKMCESVQGGGIKTKKLEGLKVSLDRVHIHVFFFGTPLFHSKLVKEEFFFLILMSDSIFFLAPIVTVSKAQSEGKRHQPMNQPVRVPRQYEEHNQLEPTETGEKEITRPTIQRTQSVIQDGKVGFICLHNNC